MKDAMDFKLFNKLGYFEQLTTDFNQLGSGDIALVATMDFDSSIPAVRKLIQAMTESAKRGAKVSLLVDARTFVYGSKNGLPGPLWWRPTMDQSFHGPFLDRYTLLQAFKSAGGQLGITNPPKRRFSLPIAGRSHIKAAIITNQVYLGGCNLDDENVADMMLSFENSQTAQWLREQLEKLRSTEQNFLAFGSTDKHFKISETASIIIDAGVRGQSDILAAAHELIDQAEGWLFLTCQFFPGGKTADHLKAAIERGVQVEILYGHPSAHGSGASLQYLQQAYERLRLPGTMFKDRLDQYDPKLHAKILCSEKAAMIGSHNYVSQGVTLGTAEIAFRDYNSELAKQLRKALLSQLSTMRNT